MAAYRIVIEGRQAKSSSGAFDEEDAMHTHDALDDDTYDVDDGDRVKFDFQKFDFNIFALKSSTM